MAPPATTGCGGASQQPQLQVQPVLVPIGQQPPHWPEQPKTQLPPSSPVPGQSPSGDAVAFSHEGRAESMAIVSAENMAVVGYLSISLGSEFY
jgi:hypothetical protein